MEYTSPKSATELLARYRRGEREFSEIDISGADLFRACLSGCKLTKAGLSRADLNHADLSDTELSNAFLTGAHLAGALLTGASLRGADLNGADLSGADLSGADLSSANLSRANLTRAKLTHANLTRATLDGTSLVAVVLPDVIGLGEVRHAGPSHLGERTLEHSRGKLPDLFLRGVGFSDWQIQMARLYDPALRSDQRIEILYEIQRLQDEAPIVFRSVFISYSTKDEEFCLKLYADLQEAGVRCWFAPHDVKSGQKLHEQIERGIHMQDRLLLVLSEASMSSPWVKTEIANAREKEISQGRNVLFPISLVSFDAVRRWKLFDADAGTDTGREVREYYIPDFSDWRDETQYQAAFARLVRDLRAADPERT